MRAPLSLSAVLSASVVLAAPAPPDTPPGKEGMGDEACVFALKLLRTADQVAASYVRPVSHEELLEKALVGLYEAARQAPPRTLTADIRKALLAKAQPAAAEEAPPNPQNAAQTPEADRAIVELIRHVRESIGDPPPLRDRDPLLICCEAMVGGLDPYSGVVTSKDLRRNTAEEVVEGFGLELSDNAGVGPTAVQTVQPGGPTQRAGIRPGDEIVRIDERAVADMLPDERGRLLHPAQPALISDLDIPISAPTQAGPPVERKIEFRRPQGTAQAVVLKCQRFHPETVLGVSRQEDNSWTYWIDERAGLAHARLAALGKGSAAELRGVVSSLHDGGLRGLILDLRWCPGGVLNEAVDSASLFLDGGVVATVHARGKDDVVHRSDGQGAFTDFPVVVLVNGQTSGGAELIAAALQDRGRAVVAGQRTVGKGSVQTQLPLAAPGAALKLTNGAILRPSRKGLQREPGAGPDDDWGVRPDDGLEFRVSPDLARALKRDWERQTLRPGGSAERLPLDDPDADPQRQAALECLRERVRGAGRQRS